MHEEAGEVDDVELYDLGLTSRSVGNDITSRHLNQQRQGDKRERFFLPEAIMNPFKEEVQQDSDSSSETTSKNAHGLCHTELQGKYFPQFEIGL